MSAIQRPRTPGESTMMNSPERSLAGLPGLSKLPGMPKVGLPENAYLKVAHSASKTCDDLVRDAAKVGQYLTLGTRDPDQAWPEKLRAFRHALKKHAIAPDHADDVTKHWYKRLADHVRKHAGREALRLAVELNERFEMRRGIGQSADEIAEDAEEFFDGVCPHCDRCPPIYRPEEWEQVKTIRDRWI